jgi:hypothetical protein
LAGLNYIASGKKKTYGELRKLGYNQLLQVVESPRNSFYERRSTVVQGSDIGVASVKDYWLMLNFARATLKNFIQFVGANSLTKPTAVFAKLVESEHVGPLLKWLEEEFVTDYSKSIAESLRGDLAGK